MNGEVKQWVTGVLPWPALVVLVLAAIVGFAAKPIARVLPFVSEEKFDLAVIILKLIAIVLACVAMALVFVL